MKIVPYVSDHVNATGATRRSGANSLIVAVLTAIPIILAARTHLQ